MRVVDLLPPATLAYIRRFLEEEKTGQIVLEVKDGRIIKGHVTEHWKEQPLTEPTISA